MKARSKPLLMIARVLLGIGLVWLVASRTQGFGLALSILSSPAALLSVVAFSLVGAIVESVRLATLLRAESAAIALADAFRLTTAAFAFNFCIPGGATGDLSKLFYLRGTHGGKGWELATAIFVDRLVGLLSLLVTILVLGAFAWPLVRTSGIFTTLYAVAAAAAAAIVAFAILCLFATPGFRRRLEGALRRLPWHRVPLRIAEAFFRFNEHRAAVFRAFLLSVVGNVAGAAVFTVLGWALYPLAPFPEPALLSLFGTFANTVTITPGGLGVGEAAFGVLFAQAGLAGGAAMMIVWRVGMVPLCLLGLAFYVAGLRPRAA